MDALVTVTLDSQRVIAAVIATATLVGAIAYLSRVVKRAGRTLGAILRIVERELDAGPQSEPVKTVVNRELTNNHGSSMKDDLDGLTTGFGLLARQVDGLQADFDDHIKERRTP